MSYSRFGVGSDLYIFHHINGYFQVYGKSSNGYTDATFDDIKTLYFYLLELKEEGVRIPDDTMKRIKEEMLRGEQT